MICILGFDILEIQKILKGVCNLIVSQFSNCTLLRMIFHCYHSLSIAHNVSTMVAQFAATSLLSNEKLLVFYKFTSILI